MFSLLSCDYYLHQIRPRKNVLMFAQFEHARKFPEGSSLALVLKFLFVSFSEYRLCLRLITIFLCVKTYWIKNKSQFFVMSCSLEQPLSIRQEIEHAYINTCTIYLPIQFFQFILKFTCIIQTSTAPFILKNTVDQFNLQHMHSYSH